MKIIILGVGRVGESVAESLVSEANDITLIDMEASRLRDLEDRFDLRGVVGDGIDPKVLNEAGAPDTDLLIACSSSDATNLVCCKVAQMHFNIPARIARVHDAALMHDEVLMSKEGFGVDQFFCPEESLTRYLHKLVQYPEALQVRKFADGLVNLVSVRASTGAPMVAKSIKELRSMGHELPMRLVAIYRRFEDEPDRFIMCRDDTRIRAGEEVFVLCASEYIARILAGLHNPLGEDGKPRPWRRVQNIMIAGGGRVGFRLAQQLHEQFTGMNIKIVEIQPERCVALASLLPTDILVLRGDATDEDLLASENIEDVDLFLALTQDDENNIMSSLLAKRMGAKRVLALINRRSYADLMHGTQIDIALAPAQAMLGELLAYVRRGDVQAVHSLRRGQSEALEIVARGDKSSSRVVGRRVEDVRWPRDVQAGLIVRGMSDAKNNADRGERQDLHDGMEQQRPRILLPEPDTVIESGDHIILFLPSKRQLREVEKLFHVSATFF